MIVLLSAPGFTSESQVPRSLATAGLGSRELLAELIEVAAAGQDARVSIEGGPTER